jgi:polysaccharide biosynthesis transport protein
MTEETPSGKLVPIDNTALRPVERWDYSPAAPSPGWPRSLDRNVSILRRYKWVVLGVTLLALAIGIIVSRQVRPIYEVAATIWIQPRATDADRSSGPMRTRELLNTRAWIELLKSYRIADAVVRELNLYVRPQNVADTALFNTFRVAERFQPGVYDLVIDRDRQRWVLNQTQPVKQAIDSGSVADSVGRVAGMQWVLPPTILAGPPERRVAFTVSTPREAAVGLIERLDAELPENSNFLALRMRDHDPVWAQTILNTWTRVFVDVASDLKKRNVVQLAGILGGQLEFAESSLRGAEEALQNFRTRTITLPGEGDAGADPALRSYFAQRVEYDDLRSDRQALEQAIAGATSGRLPWETVLLVPSAAQSAGADALRDAFGQLQTKRAELLTKQQVYTDRHPAVQEVASSIQTLEEQTIPRLSRQLLLQLNQRERDYSTRLASSSGELRSIPTRTIEDLRLRRQVAVSEELYRTLQARYSEARLAEESATPDIAILDSAIAPLYPTSNKSSTILITSIIIGLAAAFGGARLLDRFDGKIRYSEQVVDSFGLPIAGAIPLFPKGGVSAGSAEEASQLVESIRSVRMHLLTATERPLSVAISSPSPQDGKSFLAVNLALSCADAGLRTILVDADTRRGKLQQMFAVSDTPGLTEYLSGTSDLEEVIRETSTENLSLIPCGKRRAKSPELLTSSALPALAAKLRDGYDVVIFDTPPLNAGVDAYAIAASARNIALVFRVGKTSHRMAAAKIALLERLPIRIVAAVLNGVDLRGEFEPYRYAYDYAAYDADGSTGVVISR